MKTIRFFVVAGAILIAGIIFHSCRKESAAPQINEEKMLKDAITCAAELPSSPVTLYDNTHTWGNGDNSNHVTITAYNDMVKTYITITNESNANAGMTIRYANPGMPITPTTGPTIYSSSAPGSTTVEIPHAAGWECGEEITFSFYISGLGGPPAAGGAQQTGVLSFFLAGLCTTTALEADINPVCVGEEVTLTAAVTTALSGATGTVMIMEGEAVKAEAQNNMVTFSYVPDTEGTRTFYAIYEGADGFCDSESLPVNVVAEPCGCETSMTGSTGSCDMNYYDGDFYLGNRMAEFTFTPDEAGSFSIQGGLTNFTGEYYFVYKTHGTVTSEVPEQSSSRIIRIEGMLEECEMVTVTVYWTFTGSDPYFTGSWSAGLNGTEVMIVDEMICEDSKTGYPPPPPAE